MATTLIHVVLDNNALQYLCDDTRFDYHLNHIYEYNYEKKLEIHFNPINFFEQLRGVNETHFAHIRRVIDRAYQVTRYGAQMLSPKYHIADCIRDLSEAELREERIGASTLFEKLMSCKSFSDFRKVLGSSQDFILDHSRIDLQDRTNISAMMADHRKGIKDPPQYSPTADEETDAAKLLFAHTVLKFLSLLQHVIGITFAELYAKCPSFKYLIDVLYYYYSQLYENAIKPRVGDMSDILQVCYLDICDYIITNDGKFTRLIENCGNRDLSSRAMTYDDFIRSLPKCEYPKRAPYQGKDD